MTIGLLLSGAKKVFIRYTAYLPLLFLLGICFPILFGDRTGAENLRFTNIGEGRMWEVHLGDFAPVQGRPVPDPDAEWLPFDDRVTPSPPVPRQYEGMYWMRIPIPQLGGIQDPQLFIRGYKHIQLFVESRLIYEFNMEHPDPKVNKFIHWGLAPLQSSDAAKMLYVRIFQSDNDPLMGSFLLGSRADVYVNMIKRDMLRVILFVMFLFLAAVSFVLHANSRKHSLYFHFGVLASCAAYGAIGRAQVLQLVADFPLFVYLQDVALPIGTCSLFLFLGGMYERRIRTFSRYAALLMAVFVPVAGIAAFVHTDLYRYIIANIYIYAALGSFLVIIGLLVASYIRHRDAETLWVLTGCFSLCLFAFLHHVQMSLVSYDFMMFRYWPGLTTYFNETLIIIGVMLFVLSLGVVLVLRLALTQRKLGHYAEELELKNNQLLKLDKLKDDFLARTSHELRTPLYGMIGLAETLLDHPAISGRDETVHRMSLLIASGRRLSRLINDILDLSKMKHDDLQLNVRPTDIRQAADIVVMLLQAQASKRRVRIVNVIAPGLPAAAADEDRLEQILFNLIGNAIKFTDDGEVRVAAEVDGNLLRICVADTGIGIPQHDQATIFDAFAQAGNSFGAFAGTGLGLTVTKQLVELHGGTLSLRSEPGAGSTFCFTLPVWKTEQRSYAGPALLDEQNDPPGMQVLQQPSQERKPVGLEPNPAYSNNYKILIVDDEPVNLEVLVAQLQSEYDVIPVESAEAALLWMAEGGKPDLIITDIMMPKVNGYELCARIRQTYRDVEIPILMLTAKALPEDVAEGLDMGANDYLPKPVYKKELLSRIKTHLKISKLTLSLEEEVRIRTADLEETNRQLQASIKETIRAVEEVVSLEERNRVAHEIHDTVGHTLTATIVQLEATKRLLVKDIETARTKLDSAQQLVRKGLEDIRSVVKMMRDDVLNNDLSESLAKLISDTESITGIQVDYRIEPLPDLPPLLKKAVYHALQEGLTNGLKHGASTHFRFRLGVREGQLHFSLYNNGKPLSQAAYGYGLSAMRERIRNFNGTMEVKSASDSGCELILIVPLSMATN
jgi:two-component system sensor histidine kinase ChiS